MSVRQREDEGQEEPCETRSKPSSSALTSLSLPSFPVTNVIDMVNEWNEQENRLGRLGLKRDHSKFSQFIVIRASPITSMCTGCSPWVYITWVSHLSQHRVRNPSAYWLVRTLTLFILRWIHTKLDVKLIGFCFYWCEQDQQCSWLVLNPCSFASSQFQGSRIQLNCLWRRELRCFVWPNCRKAGRNTSRSYRTSKWS